MIKLLVVDDSVSSLKQISALLEGKYEVFLAKSGSMALKIGAQEKPDIVLLDIEMPEMDGYQTFAKLKEESWYDAIPVVFITGNKDEETKAKCLEYGAKAILTKPVDKDSLHKCVELYHKK